MRKFIRKLEENYINIISLMLSLCMAFNFIQVFPSTLNIFAEDTEEIIYGDINNDTNINILDVISLKNALLYNKQVSIDTADVNDDGIVNVQDLLLIKEYILGKISVFPIQTSKLQALVDEVNSTRDVEIQMTPEMLSKTEELGTPEAVYEFVKNNVRNEFYYGSKKGAKGTFEELSGNNIDQASLLIAMLQYLGYNANYAESTIKLSIPQINNWTCTTNSQTIANLLGIQANVTQINLDSENKVHISQTWVQVEIDGITYNLDPSFKQYEPQSNSISNKLDDYGIDTEEILDSAYYYDEYDFNSTIKEYQSIISKYSNEEVYVNNNKITPVEVNALPTGLEYELEDESNIASFSSIQKENSKLSNKVTFTLGIDWLGDANLKTFRTTEIYGKNIIVRYDGNNAPELYINNELELSYKHPYFESGYITPTLEISVNGNTTSVELTSNSIYAITLNYGSISTIALENAYNDVFNVSKEVTETNVLETEYIGSFLRLAGVMYFAQLDIENYLLAQQYNVYQDTQCSICITSYNSKDKNLCIDVPSTWNNVFNLSTLIDEDDTTVRDYRATSSMISSKLEDTIWHELIGYESASTTNVFEEATRNDIELLMISSANIDTELSKWAYTDNVYNDVKITIQNIISAGGIVIIPTTEVNINSWYGTGYIAINPTTGITIDKVISRTTGLILNGGYSTVTVDTMFLVNAIASIDGIYVSLNTIDFGLAMMSLNPVVGGAIAVYGTYCLICSMYAYFENIDLMYQYMNGEQYAGDSIIINGAINIVQFGLNQVIQHMETPAVTSKYIDIYGKDVTNAMSKGDPDFIAYPDGTIVAMKGVYETTGNPDNVTQLANIINNNLGLDKFIEDYYDETINFIVEYGIDKLDDEVLGIIDKYYIDGFEIIIDYGIDSIDALKSNGLKLIEASKNNNTAQVNQLLQQKNVPDFSSLKNTQIFKLGTSENCLEHIFIGQTKTNKKGITSSSGFHYEGYPNTKGKITTLVTPTNTYGLYAYNVEIDGIPKGKESTFFPKNWTPQQVVDAINEAYTNRVHLKNNRYRGTCSAGFTIEMQINVNGKVTSAYPIIGTVK